MSARKKGLYRVDPSVCIECGIDPDFPGNVWDLIAPEVEDYWHRIVANLVPWRVPYVILHGPRYYHDDKNATWNYSSVFGSHRTKAQAIIVVEVHYIPKITDPGIIAKLRENGYLTPPEEHYLKLVSPLTTKQKLKAPIWPSVFPPSYVPEWEFPYSFDRAA